MMDPVEFNFKGSAIKDIKDNVLIALLDTRFYFKQTDLWIISYKFNYNTFCFIIFKTAANS